MQQPFPRPLLLGAAAMIVFVTLAVALESSPTAGRVERAAPDDSGRALRFVDRADGAIVVYDDPTGREVATIAAGGGGFVRAALRALSRDRKLGHATPDAPFLLERDPSGRLRLIDTTNGRVVELAAFGPTNAGAFAALLTAGSDEP